MILIGELSLWVALLMAAWGTTAGFAGAATGRAELMLSGRRALYATWAFVVLAALGLWTALLTSDFSFRFVASFTSANLPSVYKFTAFWAGQAGSLLLWALILTTYSTIAVATGSRRSGNQQLMQWVVPTLCAIALFFILTLCFGSNPYERLDFIPPDGRGLNPQLQNPGMAAHPPNLYLGYIATSIPFAYAVAALVTRRLDNEWLTSVRRWVLVSWFFNTVGIVLGMWWAYVELGWGGYWAWDPVENASFLPWLVNTAFLHSIMVQEKRGMLRKWNVTLVVSAFLLAIFGTFITRSGVISSVHAFAQSSVGYWFLGFLVLAITVAAVLVSTRLNDLKAKAQLESLVSREASFLFNNLFLCAIAFSILWGTLYPIISEAVQGTKVTVGPPFFNKVNVPLGLLLLALTGVGPLIAWRRASVANLRRQFTGPLVIGALVGLAVVGFGMRDVGAVVTYALGGFVLATIVQEFQKGIVARHRMYDENYLLAFWHLVVRNRRRYGGYIVHVGVVVLFAAFAGLAFKKQFDVTLRGGQKYETVDPYGAHWTFVSQGVSNYDELNRHTTAVLLDMWRDGKRVGVIRSEKRQYIDSRGEPTFEPATEVGIRSGLRQDVYVVLAGVIGEDQAEMRITFNPLVWWVWYGGMIMAVGGLIVMWPQAERRKRQAGYEAALSPAAAGAGE